MKRNIKILKENGNKENVRKNVGERRRMSKAERKEIKTKGKHKEKQ